MKRQNKSRLCLVFNSNYDKDKNGQSWSKNIARFCLNTKTSFKKKLPSLLLVHELLNEFLVYCWLTITIRSVAGWNKPQVSAHILWGYVQTDPWSF